MQVSDIIGDYEVDIKLKKINNQHADLHNPKYFLSLARDSKENELAAGLKAFLDEERSLLIPKTTYLSGSFVGDPDANFQILGQITQKADDENNPFGKEIRRQITYVGRRSNGIDGLSPLDLKGEYYENIYGVFDQPIQLVGTFTAGRLSPVPKKQDAQSNKHGEHEIPAAIGDTPGTLTLDLDIEKRVSITDVVTALNIQHPEPEALTMTLTAPKQAGAQSATTLVLHNKQNRSIKNLSFDDEDAAVDPLALLRGQVSLGTWTLNITNVSSSVGTLESWNLTVNGAKVYQVIGTTTPGVRLKITGCGITQFANSYAQTGDFTFDGLIPCDYEISVAQFGYEITTTQLLIEGCDTVCNTLSDYQVDLNDLEDFPDHLSELSPKLIATSDNVKVVVSPTRSYLPTNSDDKLKLQAVDVTDYSKFGKTVQSRTWELYKRTNSWSAINSQGYLVDVQSSINQVPPGNNYISYSEDFTQWNSGARLTLNNATVIDPRGGYGAVKVAHDGSGSAGIIFSSNAFGGQGFELAKDEFVTFSVFVKEGTNDEIRLRFGNGSDFLNSAIFDFTTGAVTGIAYTSLQIMKLANGWSRVSITYQATQNYEDFHCDAWYAKDGKYDAVGASHIYLFGPQCEKHATEPPMVPVMTNSVNVFIPQQNMSGYIATGATHGVRSTTNFQDVLISSKSSNHSENWVYEIDHKPSNAGVYYLKFIADVNSGRDLEYTTQDIHLVLMDSTMDIHVGQFSVHAAAGSAGKNSMDSATFDIDRPEVGDHNPLKDSFFFSSAVDPTTQTNKPDLVETSVWDEPAGNNANHFRIFVTTGQLYQTGSMYGAQGRLDVGIQSQEAE